MTVISQFWGVFWQWPYEWAQSSDTWNMSSSFRAATHVSGSNSCVLEGDNDPFAVLWVQSNNYELEP